MFFTACASYRIYKLIIFQAIAVSFATYVSHAICYHSSYQAVTKYWFDDDGEVAP